MFESADALLDAMKSQVPLLVSKTSQSILAAFLPQTTEVSRHFAHTFPGVIESVTTSALLTVAHSRIVPPTPPPSNKDYETSATISQTPNAQQIGAVFAMPAPVSKPPAVAKVAVIPTVPTKPASTSNDVTNVDKPTTTEAAVDTEPAIAQMTAAADNTESASDDPIIPRDAGVTKSRGRTKKTPNVAAEPKQSALDETKVETLLNESPVRSWWFYQNSIYFSSFFGLVFISWLN